MENYLTPHRPLRVAHLIQYFAIGGLERMVERLAVGCKSQGIESVVIAYLGDGPIRDALAQHDVRTVLLDAREGLEPALTLRLRAVLRHERIDVLHTHHLGPFMYGAPAAILSRCRHVHTEHSHELYDTRRRRLVGAMMAPLSEVVAVAPEISAYRKRFPGRCRVIPNGVALPPDDPSRRSRARAHWGIEANAFAVGCAARLSAEKDHVGLLEAFARLRTHTPQALLLCAGDGPLRSQLAACARDKGLEPYVRWLGSIEDMASFYAALDVCVLNSQREGMPLSLLEAMSFGVPVVASHVGGVGELLAHDAGVLVPPNDPARLADALAGLALSKEVRTSVGNKGRDRVRESYGIERMIEEYVAIYRKLVRRPLPPTNPEAVLCV